MKATLQATGHAPVTFDYTDSFAAQQMVEGDKRGVRLTIFWMVDSTWAAELVYLTSWGIERAFSRVFVADKLSGDYCEPHRPMDVLIRAAAKTILPPGAGFPATPQYETRQAKLAGMMETLTLVALSEVLAEAQPVKTPPPPTPRHPA